MLNKYIDEVRKAKGPAPAAKKEETKPAEPKKEETKPAEPKKESAGGGEEEIIRRRSAGLAGSISFRESPSNRGRTP